VDPPGHARLGGLGSRPSKTSDKDEVHLSGNGMCISDYSKLVAQTTPVELSDSSIDGLSEGSEGTPFSMDIPKTPKKTAKILGHADIMAKPRTFDDHFNN
jgi:hypothetical protein